MQQTFEEIATDELEVPPEKLQELIKHRRIESTGPSLQVSVEGSHTGERLAQLDRILEQKYHKKISQVKRFIKELEPHYLNFVDQQPPTDLEKEHLLVDKLNRRVNYITSRYGQQHNLVKEKAKSLAQFKQPPKRNDYNKWYIRPEQRFLQKKSNRLNVDTNHYLQRILEGGEINRKQSNPFQKKPKDEHSNSPGSTRAGINPNIIKKAAKVMEKSDTRVPVFFLPYLKKQEDA